MCVRERAHTHTPFSTALTRAHTYTQGASERASEREGERERAFERARAILFLSRSSPQRSLGWQKRGAKEEVKCGTCCTCIIWRWWCWWWPPKPCMGDTIIIIPLFQDAPLGKLLRGKIERIVKYLPLFRSDISIFWR